MHLSELGRRPYARGTLAQIDANLAESTREPRIGFAQPTCQVDQSLGLSGRPLAFSDDGLQPLRSLLGITHQGEFSAS